MNDILWIKSDAGSVEIITTSTKIVSYVNLSSFSRQIQHPNLIRIHRSYIVNQSKIISFNDGNVNIPYQNEIKQIPIGKTYREVIDSHFLMLKAD